MLNSLFCTFKECGSVNGSANSPRPENLHFNRSYELTQPRFSLTKIPEDKENCWEQPLQRRYNDAKCQTRVVNDAWFYRSASRGLRWQRTASAARLSPNIVTTPLFHSNPEPRGRSVTCSLRGSAHQILWSRRWTYRWSTSVGSLLGMSTGDFRRSAWWKTCRHEVKTRLNFATERRTLSQWYCF